MAVNGASRHEQRSSEHVPSTTLTFLGVEHLLLTINEDVLPSLFRRLGLPSFTMWRRARSFAGRAISGWVIR
jgi:hypothetical protein